MKKAVAVLKAAVCAFALVGVVLFAGCGGGKSALVGQWVDVDPKPNDTEEFELFSDGTASFKNGSLTVSGTWKIVDKRFLVSVSMSGTTMSEAYDYKISGYELTLVNNNGDTSICVRKEKLGEFKEKQAAKPDSRDNKKYKYVTIGSQTWMAENLNYAAEGSQCYENSEDSCAKYGRLYNWITATTACPAGWHLPKNDEWGTLIKAVGGDSTAGKKLKSTTGWNENGNGTDEYGFSALPGGYRLIEGTFNDVGNYGRWWSATPASLGSGAERRRMDYNSDGVEIGNNVDKTSQFSVRCVQN